MVLGPPVFALTFLKGYRPLVFHLPFWTGVALGVVMQLSSSPCCKGSMSISRFQIGNGTYKTLLGFNVVSALCCWGLAALALLDNRAGRKLEGQDKEDYAVADVHGKVPGVKATSLLGLPVPAFLRGGGGGARDPGSAGGVHDSSSSRGTGAAMLSKDAGVAGAPVSLATAGAGEGAAPAPAAGAAGQAGGATPADRVGQ